MGQSASRLDHVTLGTVSNITSAGAAVATILTPLVIPSEVEEPAVWPVQAEKQVSRLRQSIRVRGCSCFARNDNEN